MVTKDLPYHLADTLEEVPARGFRSTAEVFKRLRNSFIGQSAVSNRLNALLKMGLVVFERRGKEKFWSRK